MLLHGGVEVLQQRHRLQVGDIAVLVGDPLAVLLPEVAVDPLSRGDGDGGWDVLPAGRIARNNQCPKLVKIGQGAGDWALPSSVACCNGG